MALQVPIIVYNSNVKLKAANFLELSLSLAFALIVLTTSIFLLQESIERVNSALNLQQFQQNAMKVVYRASALSDWEFNADDDYFSDSINHTMFLKQRNIVIIRIR